MEALSYVSFLICILAILVSVWYFFRLIFCKPEKKLRFRNRFFASGGAAILGFVCAIAFGNARMENEAEMAGFSSSSEYLAAKEDGITDPVVWSETLEKRKAEEAERIAQAEEQRLAELEACKRDINCWGEKALAIATIGCPENVERMAKYDYEWTDGLLDMKFSHYKWRDIDAGTVTVLGDKVKFQNGFGAWANMVYECDVNPSNGMIIDVRVSNGRL
jgi:hypothetical protein